MKAADMLVEIGTEELPPKALRGLMEAFADNLPGSPIHQIQAWVSMISAELPNHLRRPAPTVHRNAVRNPAVPPTFPVFLLSETKSSFIPIPFAPINF